MKKRVVSLLLAIFLLVGLMPTAYAVDTAPQTEETTVSAVELPGESRQNGADSGTTEDVPEYSDDTMVTVIVEMEGPSVMDGYQKGTEAVGMTVGEELSNYLGTQAAENAAQQALAQQSQVLTEIQGIAAYSADQAPVQVLSQWTTVVNGMAVQMPYGKLAEVRKADGVKRAYVAHTYDAPEPTLGNDDTVYGYSYDLVNLSQAWAQGYSGKGMLVAVLDTGLDMNFEQGKGVTRVHEAFTDESFRSDLADTDLRYNSKSIAALLTRTQLNATTDENGDKIVYEGNALYKNRKVPFAYDYAGTNGLSGDLDVRPAGDHGTHVAGTIAGYAATEEGEVKFSGIAPDAQLAIMKVFGDATQGAREENIISALEDAMKIGADVVNLSLGSDNGFAHDDSVQNEIYQKMEDAGIVVVVAAGNSDTSATENNLGGKVLAENPEFSMVSSPAVYDSNLSVASYENTVNTEAVLVWKGEDGVEHTIAFQDPNDVALKKAFGEGETEIISVPNQATSYNDFTAAGFSWWGNGGKTGIALVSRGTNSFEAKVTYAAYFTNNDHTSGVRGVLVYDNDPEGDTLINMALGDNNTLPAAFIKGKDAQELLAACEKGKVTMHVERKDRVVANGTANQMSSFSSWGAGPALELKPEITAPGGYIWSTVVDPLYSGGDYTGGYEMMSGTSMATPHVAGMSALVRQYVENGLAITDRQESAELTNELLVSTAVPQLDPDGMYYSPRSQGAGLANVGAAVTTPAYISVEGQKVGKLELGDDPDWTGTYPLNFRVNNLTEDTLTYKMKVVVLSAAYEDGYILPSEQLIAELDMGTVTVPAGGCGVSETLQLTHAQIGALMDEFSNGAYVEGFVILEDAEGVNPQIGLPFLGFLGDWTKAPILDSALWTDQESMEGDPTWGASYFASLYQVEGETLRSQILGQNPFDANVGENQTAFYNENVAISPNGDGYFDSVNCGVLMQLRNAKMLVAEVRNKETGELYFRDYALNEFKTFYHNTYAQTLVASMSGGFVDGWNGTDAQGNLLPSGTKCTYTVTMYTDGDYPSHVDEATGETIMDYDLVVPGENEPTFNGHAMDMTGDTYSFDVTVDTEAPKLVDNAATLRQKDGETYISGVFTDDGAIATVQIYPEVMEYNSWSGTSTKTVDFDHPFYVDNVYDAAVGERRFEARVDKDAYTGNKEWTGVVYVYGGDYGCNERVYGVMVDNADGGIQLSNQSFLLYPGEQAYLGVNNNTDEQGTLTRVSSNPKIATVDEEGNITAVAPGQALITVSNGKASAICVVAVEERVEKLEDFKLSIDHFSGLKPGAQLEVRITDIQPGDVDLTNAEKTYDISAEDPELDSLLSCEVGEDGYSFYIGVPAVGEPKKAGKGTFSVTIDGTTRTLEFDWQELYEKSNQEDIVPKSYGNQTVYVNPGETVDLIAQYNNKSEHKFVNVALYTGKDYDSYSNMPTTEAEGLVLDGPTYCTAGGSWTGKIVNKEGYKLPESIRVFFRTEYSSGPYETEKRNSQWYTYLSYDPETGEISIPSAPYSTTDTLVIRADGVASEGEPAGTLSGNTYVTPDGVYGPFDWSITEGQGTLTPEEGFMPSGTYETVNGAHFTMEEPGVSYVTAKSKDGKYSVNYAVICRPVTADTLELDAENVTMLQGETLTPEVKLSPEPSLEKDKELTYTVFDPDVVSVKDGVVTALKPGYTVVKVQVKSDASVYNFFSVTVTGTSTVTYRDGADGTAFADEVSKVETGSLTPAFTGSAKRTGYTFQGWDPAVAPVVTGDATYTATWKANTYTVHLMANGADLDQDAVTVTYDAPVGQLPTPTRKGYTFAGWLDANGKRVTADTIYKFAGDSAFTAFWKENGCNGGASCPSRKFTDVSTSQWYHSAVDYAVTNGLFAGTSDTTFSPNASMTRAMLVAVLWRMEGKPQAKAASGFTDVSASQYYAEAVAWAKENGIVAGTSKTTFSPNAEITREQMAAILYRYAEKKGQDMTVKGGLSQYPDGDSVSAYAEEAMTWAVENGLVSGSLEAGQVYLQPKGSATRAQVAAILMRYAQTFNA